MRSRSVMHISPLVKIRLRMRRREVSELAKKIWAPNSMLKCFNLIECKNTDNIFARTKTFSCYFDSLSCSDFIKIQSVLTVSKKL